ncbi:DUF1236 domain-containing protein [Bradyrhizobium sp. UFLA05-109]
MTNRFMISVAALALVAGTGLANAQGTGTKESGGSQQQQNAHPSTGAAEHGGAMSREKGTVGQAGGSMKSGAEERSSGTMKHEQSGDTHRDSMGKEKGTVGQSGGSMKSGAEEKSSGTMHKNPTAEEKSGATKGQRTDEHAQGQQDRSKGMSSETQTKSGTTTGQAGAGAKLSTDQRTQITSVIREEKVAPVSNVNFSVSVGTRIPREGIELHVLPSRVATIYPEWRSYKYVLVRDEIVIIDPATYEIIAVLNA